MKKMQFKVQKREKALKALSDNFPTIKYFDFEKMLRKKDIRVNDVKIEENVYVNINDVITFFFDEKNMATRKHYSTIYEDENILVVNKQKNIEVSDGEYNIETELAKEGINVFAVHRLDRMTSGLVIFAKSENVKEKFKEAFKKGYVRKFYQAEVIGCPKQMEKTLVGYIIKNSKESIVKVYGVKQKDMDQIITKYRMLKSGKETSVLEIEIPTGKTHQIRAHMAYVGYPLLGDGKYGDNQTNKKFKENSQKLIAYKLAFEFPDSHEFAYLNSNPLAINGFYSSK